MLTATRHELRCDHPGGCAAHLVHSNPFLLWNDAKAEGWVLRRKLNGEVARRGGKDYCPKHRPGAAEAGR